MIDPHFRWDFIDCLNNFTKDKKFSDKIGMLLTETCKYFFDSISSTSVSKQKCFDYIITCLYDYQLHYLKVECNDLYCLSCYNNLNYLNTSDLIIDINEPERIIEIMDDVFNSEQTLSDEYIKTKLANSIYSYKEQLHKFCVECNESNEWKQDVFDELKQKFKT